MLYWRNSNWFRESYISNSANVMKVLWKSNPWGKAIGVAFVMFYQCVCCQLCVCVNFPIFIHNDKNGLIIQWFSNIQMEYLDRLFSKCACANYFGGSSYKGWSILRAKTQTHSIHLHSVDRMEQMDIIDLNWNSNENVFRARKITTSIKPWAIWCGLAPIVEKHTNEKIHMLSY